MADPPRWRRVLPETYGGMPGEELDAGVVGWSADGRSLFYAELEGTSAQLFRMPTGGGGYQRVTAAAGNKYSFALNRDTSQVAYVGEGFEQPSEVWIRSTGTGTRRQVSAVNAHLPPLPAVRSEEVRWRSFDGLEIEGLLHLPPDYQPGTQVPLLVELHGENDARVPVTQAYELYRALDRAGVETQLVVYPRSGHGVGEPKLAVDLLRRQIAWFEAHLMAKQTH